MSPSVASLPWALVIDQSLRCPQASNHPSLTIGVLGFRELSDILVGIRPPGTACLYRDGATWGSGTDRFDRSVPSRPVHSNVVLNDPQLMGGGSLTSSVSPSEPLSCDRFGVARVCDSCQHH